MIRAIERRHVVVAAGGSGQRMNTSVPKQFLPLAGIPVIIRTLRIFDNINPHPSVVVALGLEWHDHLKRLLNEFPTNIKPELTPGGATRFESVKNAIAHLSESSGLIMVHDAARPFASPQLIERCFELTLQKGNCIAALPPVDSAYECMNGDFFPVNRSNYLLAQTPQCFRVEELSEAYKIPYNSSFTDDASVYHEWGGKLFFTQGEPTNIKITHPHDLIIGQALLSQCGIK